MYMSSFMILYKACYTAIVNVTTTQKLGVSTTVTFHEPSYWAVTTTPLCKGAPLVDNLIRELFCTVRPIDLQSFKHRAPNNVKNLHTNVVLVLHSKLN